jgi:hypothetical protein
LQIKNLRKKDTMPTTVTEFIQDRAGKMTFEMSDGSVKTFDPSAATSSGTVGLDRLRTKLGALRSNAVPHRRASLCPAIPITVGLIPTKGSVYSAGGQLYQCAAVGTTAVATLPSGTAIKMIAPDSTGPVWMWYGPDQPLAGYPEPVQFTVGASLGAISFVGSYRAAISGMLQDTTGIYEDKYFSTIGGITSGAPFGKAELVTMAFQASGDASPVVKGANFCRTIITDSPWVALYNVDAGAVQSGMIFVDTKPVIPGDCLPLSGTNVACGVNFGSRRPRRITINQPVGRVSIYVAANSTFIQPPPGFNERLLKYVMHTDSWGGGSGTMGVAQGQGYCDSIARTLGLGETAVMENLGGTGLWRNSTSQLVPNFLLRLQQTLTIPQLAAAYANLGAHFVQCSVNDGVQGSAAVDNNSYPSSAQLTQRTVDYLTALRTASPMASLIMYNIPMDDAVNSNTEATNAAYKAGFDQFAATDSNCVFVDISATGPTGENVCNARNSSSPTANGVESYFGCPALSNNTADAHPSIHMNFAMATAFANGLYKKLGMDIEAPPSQWLPSAPVTAGGTATLNGTGSQAAFTIAHGLGYTPLKLSVNAASSVAAASYYVSADATNITVTYSTAPAAGSGNVVLRWTAAL